MTSRTSTRTKAGAALVVAGLAAGALWWVPSAGADETGATAPVGAARALDGFTVTSSATQAVVGDTVTLTVGATAVADLYAYDLGISFDPRVLAYVEDSATTDLSGSTYDRTAAGEVSVVHTKLGSSPSASGPVTLATLSFTAVSTGAVTLAATELTSVTTTADGTGTDETSTTGIGSVPLTVMAKAAALTTSAPTISGTPQVGSLLTSSPGTWSVPGLAFSYQWLRSGTPVAGATASSYALKPADVGSTMTVVVSAAMAERVTATARAGTSTVTRAPTTLTVGRAGSARPGVPVKVKLLVDTVPGLVAPGRVRVRYDGELLTKPRTLTNGKRVIFLPAKASGAYRLVVLYNPGTGFLGDREVTKVRVRR